MSGSPHASSADARSLGVSAALCDGELVAGDVVIEGGRVAAVGVAPPPGGGSGIAVPGFLDLQVNGVAGVDFLSADERGVVVSCGHTDADATAASAAFNRGARAVTHLWNAHRRWAPRDPGIGGLALVRPDVTVQAIVDHVHLAPETAYAAFLAAGKRFSLVTDAMEAAGQGDGVFRLGRREVEVRGARVALPDGSLAGSVLTMDQAVRNLVSCGAPFAEAIWAATGAPARLLGDPELGVLRVGGVADVTVLDDELRVVRTLVGGVAAAPPSPAPRSRRPCPRPGAL